MPHTQEINSTCSNFAKAVISEKKLKSSFVFSLIVVDIKHPCKTLISCIYLDAALKSFLGSSFIRRTKSFGFVSCKWSSLFWSEAKYDIHDTYFLFFTTSLKLGVWGKLLRKLRRDSSNFKSSSAIVLDYRRLAAFQLTKLPLFPEQM